MDILDDNSAQDTGDGGKAISAALTGMGAAIGSWWGGGAADKATTSSSTASGDATEVANEEEVEEEEEESGEEDDAEESSSDESAEAPSDGTVGWGSWLSTTLKKTADSASSLKGSDPHPPLRVLRPPPRGASAAPSPPRRRRRRALPCTSCAQS